MANYVLLEAGGKLELETGAGFVLLEVQPVVAGDYLVQEVDGSSRFTLENGSGFVLLESGSPPPPTPTAVQGGSIIIPRRRLKIHLDGKQGLEEDEAIALSLLLRTYRRPGQPK